MNSAVSAVKGRQTGAASSLRHFAAVLLALSAATLAAQERSPSRAPIEHSGLGRAPQFLFTVEVQSGGDELARRSTRTCVADAADQICITQQDRLNAGDGFGMGLGALIPLGRTPVDLEVAGGVMLHLLDDEEVIGDIGTEATLFRYFTRAQAMVNLRRGARIGGGLVGHWGARYEVEGQGPARKFDDALGARFQMDWVFGDGLGSSGFYIQSMAYDERTAGGATGVDAGAIGIIFSLYLE